MEKLVEQILELSKFSETKFHIDAFLKELLQVILQALQAEFCSVAFLDPANNQLFYHTGCWRKEGTYLKTINDFGRIKKGTGAVGTCAEKAALLNFSEIDIPPASIKYYEDKIGLKVYSILASPMVIRGELKGVIEVLNKAEGNIFSENDGRILSIFSHCAALTVDNARLYEENMAKDRLSSLGQSIMSSAHGLKNILNNMDGGAYIVEKGALSKNLQEVNKGWDIIKRNSNRLRDLVLDMLLYSRPKKPEYIPSDINRICDDLKELLLNTAQENKVEINLDLDRSIGDFCFDPKGIHRCLLNLISNAVYACSQKGGGRVNVTTKLTEENSLEITVSDNGTGISKDNLDHIFDVFFSTKGSKGTGLGLSVTKKIVNEHNGTIEVKSRLNIGTRFIMTLPKYNCEKKENENLREV